MQLGLGTALPTGAGSPPLLPGRCWSLGARRAFVALPASRRRSGVRVEAIAAPEKATTGATPEFRAWTSPSAKAVPKRDDLKRIMILGAGTRSAGAPRGGAGGDRGRMRKP